MEQLPSTSDGAENGKSSQKSSPTHSVKKGDVINVRPASAKSIKSTSVADNNAKSVATVAGVVATTDAATGNGTSSPPNTPRPTTATGAATATSTPRSEPAPSTLSTGGSTKKVSFAAEVDEQQKAQSEKHIPPDTCCTLQ